MHLSDASTLGANFFLIFMLGQLHIWLFYILGAFTKQRPTMVHIFRSAMVLLVVMLLTFLYGFFFIDKT